MELLGLILKKNLKNIILFRVVKLFVYFYLVSQLFVSPLEFVSDFSFGATTQALIGL